MLPFPFCISHAEIKCYLKLGLIYNIIDFSIYQGGARVFLF